MTTKTEYPNEELVALYQHADEADQMEYLGKLYEQNIGLIATVAKIFSGYCDMQDLTQEGFFGLKIAADRHDPEKGAFSTYATEWIRQVMRRYVDYHQTSMRLPVHRRNSVFRYRSIVKEYSAEHGEPPSDDYVCAVMDVNSDKLDKIKIDSDILRVKSLDESVTVDESEEYCLSDIVADPESEVRYEEVIEAIDNDKLRSLLWEAEELTEREKTVIRMRYQDQLTMRQAGEILGITAEGVRSIQESALKKFRRDKRIRAYSDIDYVESRAYSGTGLNKFRNTQTSSTEKIAIDLYEFGVESFARVVEEHMKEFKAKYGIDLGEDYRRMWIDRHKAGETITL